MRTLGKRVSTVAVALGILFGECSLAAGLQEPAAADARPVVEVTGPAEVLTLQAGEPVSISWHVRNPPRPAADWQVIVSLNTCVIGNYTTDLYEARLDEAKSSFVWTPTQELMDDLHCDDGCDPIPIIVRLYKPSEVGEESYAHDHACKCGFSGDFLIKACSPGAFVIVSPEPQ